MLAGNVVALLSPLIYIPVLTYAFGPQNYDYKSMALIRLGDDSAIVAAEHVDPESNPDGHHPSANVTTIIGLTPEESVKETAMLTRASFIAKSLTAIMTICLLVLWPMPMYGSGYVFSKPFFTGWVSVGILWLFCSAACVGIYPLWEGRHSMAHTFKGIWRDLTGKRAVTLQGREGVVREESEGSDSGVAVGEGKGMESVTGEKVE
ncbi:hypothetical protein MMC18_008184 [Xylographa bjoerkii]|nr:hypothetical protein [Xylographa bjoerkii]